MTKFLSPTPETIDFEIDDAKFTIRKKFKWAAWRPMMTAGEARTSVQAEMSENALAQQKQLARLTDAGIEVDADDFSIIDLSQENRDLVDDVLEQLRVARVEMNHLGVRELEQLVAQAESMLGGQADEFFAAIDDWDYEEARKLIEQVAGGSVGEEDPTPVQQAEDADLPLDGSSTPAQLPADQTPSGPTGVDGSSPSDTPPVVSPSPMPLP